MSPNELSPNVSLQLAAERTVHEAQRLSEASQSALQAVLRHNVTPLPRRKNLQAEGRHYNTHSLDKSLTRDNTLLQLFYLRSTAEQAARPLSASGLHLPASILASGPRQQEKPIPVGVRVQQGRPAPCRAKRPNRATNANLDVAIILAYHLIWTCFLSYPMFREVVAGSKPGSLTTRENS